MKFKDLTGKIFGNLTVIRESGRIKDGKGTRIIWLCNCSCGKQKLVRGSSLSQGLTKSCGCLAKQNSRTNRFKKRTIICETCKKEFTHSQGPNLKTCSKDCGRLRRLKYIHNLSQSDFDHLFSRIEKNTRTRAEKSNLDFNLDKEYIKTLYLKQDKKCEKTNIPFELSKGNGLKERSPWSISIDRIDNSKGYTKDNVQLVCLMYNLCKSSWTEKEIQEFCAKVVINKDKQ